MSDEKWKRKFLEFEKHQWREHAPQKLLLKPFYPKKVLTTRIGCKRGNPMDPVTLGQQLRLLHKSNILGRYSRVTPSHIEKLVDYGLLYIEEITEQFKVIVSAYEPAAKLALVDLFKDDAAIFQDILDSIDKNSSSGTAFEHLMIFLFSHLHGEKLGDIAMFEKLVKNNPELSDYRIFGQWYDKEDGMVKDMVQCCLDNRDDFDDMLIANNAARCGGKKSAGDVDMVAMLVHEDSKRYPRKLLLVSFKCVQGKTDTSDPTGNYSRDSIPTIYPIEAAEIKNFNQNTKYEMREKYGCHYVDASRKMRAGNNKANQEKLHPLWRSGGPLGKLFTNQNMFYGVAFFGRKETPDHKSYEVTGGPLAAFEKIRIVDYIYFDKIASKGSVIEHLFKDLSPENCMLLHCNKWLESSEDEYVLECSSEESRVENNTDHKRPDREKSARRGRGRDARPSRRGNNDNSNVSASSKNGKNIKNIKNITNSTTNKNNREKKKRHQNKNKSLNGEDIDMGISSKNSTSKKQKGKNKYKETERQEKEKKNRDKPRKIRGSQGSFNIDKDKTNDKSVKSVKSGKFAGRQRGDGSSKNSKNSKKKTQADGESDEPPPSKRRRLNQSSQ